MKKRDTLVITVLAIVLPLLVLSAIHYLRQKEIVREAYGKSAVNDTLLITNLPDK